MTSLNFPSSPTPTAGQEYSAAGKTWVYDGTRWGVKAASVGSVPVGGLIQLSNTSTTVEDSGAHWQQTGIYVPVDPNKHNMSLLRDEYKIVGTSNSSGSYYKDRAYYIPALSLWVAESGNQILTSTDGSYYTSVYSGDGESHSWTTGYNSTDGYIYAVDANSNLMVRSNDGTSWSVCSMPTITKIIVVEGTGEIVCGSTSIYGFMFVKSAGGSWSIVNSIGNVGNINSLNNVMYDSTYGRYYYVYSQSLYASGTASTSISSASFAYVTSNVRYAWLASGYIMFSHMTNYNIYKYDLNTLTYVTFVSNPLSSKQVIAAKAILDGGTTTTILLTQYYPDRYFYSTDSTTFTQVFISFSLTNGDEPTNIVYSNGYFFYTMRDSSVTKVYRISISTPGSVTAFDVSNFPNSASGLFGLCATSTYVAAYIKNSTGLPMDFIYTTDSGVTWNSSGKFYDGHTLAANYYVTQDLSSQYRLGSLSADPLNDKLICGSDRGILYFDNTGTMIADTTYAPLKFAQSIGNIWYYNSSLDKLVGTSYKANVSENNTNLVYGSYSAGTIFPQIDSQYVLTSITRPSDGFTVFCVFGGFITTTDFISFTSYSNTSFDSTVFKSLYNTSQGKFYVFTNNNYYLTSSDGVTWTKTSYPGSIGTVEVIGVCQTGSSVYMLVVSKNPTNSVHYIYYTTDGSTWTEKTWTNSYFNSRFAIYTLGSYTGKYSTAFFYSTTHSKFFMYVNYSSGQAWFTSPDASTWTIQSGYVAGPIYINSMYDATIGGTNMLLVQYSNITYKLAVGDTDFSSYITSGSDLEKPGSVFQINTSTVITSNGKYLFYATSSGTATQIAEIYGNEGDLITKSISTNTALIYSFGYKPYIAKYTYSGGTISLHSTPFENTLKYMHGKKQNPRTSPISMTETTSSLSYSFPAIPARLYSSSEENTGSGFWFKDSSNILITAYTPGATDYIYHSTNNGSTYSLLSGAIDVGNVIQKLGSTYVAVANNGMVYYSTDLGTWTVSGKLASSLSVNFHTYAYYSNTLYAIDNDNQEINTITTYVPSNISIPSISGNTYTTYYLRTK